MGMWGKDTPGRGNSKYKGPEVGLAWHVKKNCKEAGVAGVA